MNAIATDPRRTPLAPQEWLFLALAILGWSLFVLWLGKDTSWDFRNYHWYLPYQLLNDRLTVDIAVAHQASYYNPLLDVPFYWLASNTASWIAVGTLGAVQGANVVPLYFLARSSLRLSEFRLASGALALLGQTGAMTLSMFGTTYYDNVLSLFILSGLAILVVNREMLRGGSLWKVSAVSFIAAFLVGSTVGLKLPEAPFALGFAAALLAIGGSVKHIGTRLAAAAAGGLAGALLFSVYWMLQMDALTGNPLFPYFNDYFKSPLVLAESYRDMRFLPTSIWDKLVFPVLFTIDWQVAADLPQRDMRVLSAYVATIAALVVWLAGKRNKDPLIGPFAARLLFVFGIVSYVAWLNVFAIYRYIVTLEMLAPLVTVAGVALLPMERRFQFVVLGVLFFATLLFAKPEFVPRAPLGDPYVRVIMPPFENPDKTIVLMTGNAPLGFIATTLPKNIPVLRIDGWMVQPTDGTLLTARMKKRVTDHRGDLYLIADAYDMNRARSALAGYGLRIRWLECKTFDTNIIGLYQLCPLYPWPSKQ